MELTSGTSRVSLRPTRYEFPNRAVEDQDFDWDANWLIIRGEVDFRGKHWTFDDPCMTTREAVELGRWLRAVAEGRIEPNGLSGSGSLWFTEPNVTFGLAARDARSATILVSLGAESGPPTDGLKDEADRGIPFELPLEAINGLADAWEQGLAAFPERR